MAGSAEEERNWPQTFFHDDVLSVRVYLNIIRVHSVFGYVCTAFRQSRTTCTANKGTEGTQRASKHPATRGGEFGCDEIPTEWHMNTL